jgi:hypothetical protein
MTIRVPMPWRAVCDACLRIRHAKSNTAHEYDITCEDAFTDEIRALGWTVIDEDWATERVVRCPTCINHWPDHIKDKP